MTDARERELLDAVRGLNCPGEIEGFRGALAEAGEKLTAALMAALADRERAVMPCGMRGAR